MEFVRYLNGVTVSEKELTSVKVITPEIAEAVNEVRRRTSQNSITDKVIPTRHDG
ncbi:MAG: hypothetical protein IJ404_06640 [Clostridia bacterium]|nr:hypothetical protein [Clostridia bacterium]